MFLACQEIQIEGNVVGTICSTSSSPVSCECTSTEECVQTEVGGEPILATCVSSAGIVNIIILHRYCHTCVMQRLKQRFEMKIWMRF